MSYWSEKIKIGNLEFPRFIGGPLDGITDSPFRKVVRTFSPQELLYGEMRHVGCVSHEKSTQKALAFEQSERPFTYQVSANSLAFIEQACEKIVAAGVDCLDLNCGCPARAVVTSGSGSALMADMPKLKLILQAFRKNLSIPFTLKIRAGYKEKNAVEVAKLAQDCGVDALSIHPRLQTQMFTGVPDYLLAAQVKQAVSIPVIFSGGVVNWATAQEVYERTGVDGYLIGRGIWSRPWKLQELSEVSQGRAFVLDHERMVQAMLEHFDNTVAYYGASSAHGVKVFRKHMPFYIKGKPTASALRQKLVLLEDPIEVRQALVDFFT